MSLLASPRSSHPYFPMLLANGKDAVLVGYNGSMVLGDAFHAHNEQNQGVVCGWYKTVHRTDRHEGIQPIIQAGYQLYCNGEYYDIDNYEQQFDARTAILVSRISAGGFQYTVQSYLDSDSVLSEHYEFEELPAGECELHLSITEPTAGLYPTELPGNMQFAVESYNSDDVVVLRYESANGKGIGYHRCDVTPDEITLRRIVIKGIQPGYQVTRTLCMMDDAEGGVGEAKSHEVQRRLDELNTEERLDKHCKEWARYSDRSSISIPDKHLQDLYDLSIYTLRAHQRPDTGSVTVGMYPPLWGGGGVFGYDSYYLQQAMLRSNHVAESAHLVEFWNDCIPVAKSFAQELDQPGVFFPWWSLTPMGKSNGLSEELKRGAKRFDTCAVPFEALRHYESTGDSQTLRDSWGLVTGCIEFLLAETIQERSDEAVIKDLEGATESTSVSNDTLTACVLSKVLEMTIEYAGFIGKEVPGRYRTILDKLKTGLSRNTKDGVMMPYRGAANPMILPVMLAVWNLPEGVDRVSIEAGLAATRTEWGLSSGVCNQQYRDWPWFHFRAAIACIFAGIGDPYQHIRNGLVYHSSLGAFPEKIRLDGYAIAYWYSAVHALLAFSVTALLVNESAGVINVFKSTPAEWTEIEIECLRVPPGYVVSAKVNAGRCRFLSVQNDTEIDREIVLSVPGSMVGYEEDEKRYAFDIGAKQTKTIIDE